MFKRIFILFILILISLITIGQDPQFSQFYSNSLYLAPSFSGITGLNRVSLNYRNQWPRIPKGFITYSLSLDRHFDKFNSGLGVLIFSDQAGSGQLSTTHIGLMYSYDFRLFNRLHIRPGMQFAYVERDINFEDLLWNDQISASGNAPVSGEVMPLEKVGDIDFTVSAMAYSEHFWIGMNVDHLLRPNQSLYDHEQEEGNMGLVPVKYAVFGGVKIITRQELLRPVPTSVQLAFIYKQQDQFRQLDIGAYWNREPIVLGLWYRGIPLYKEVFNRDALTLLTGYKINNLNIGYSYDFTISRLITSTGGSHEISLSILFKTKKIKKRRKMVPCVEF